MKCIKFKQDGVEEGYDYFQNLLDELIIEIFTKLSTGQGPDTLADIKSLGQCSIVSKRFNSLTSLVHALSISHFSIVELYFCCPKILNKFKHIRSLHLEYESDTKGVKADAPHIPHIYTKAVYVPPHNYIVVVLSATSVDVYPDQQEDYPTHSLMTATEDEFDLILATKIYASSLFYLHHMLLLSIQDHKLLQEVVVTDSMRRESFTLAKDQLVQLRNINTDVSQIQGCHKAGFCNVLSVPLSDGKILFKNLTFGLFEKWQENSTGRRDNDIPQFEGNRGIVIQQLLERMLGMEADLSIDYEIVPEMMSEIVQDKETLCEIVPQF